MKRIISAVLIIVFVAALAAACGQTAAPAKTTGAKETAASSKETESVSAETSIPAESRKDVLVVVFSATGTTKAVADRIAAYADADLYEIKAAQEYTAADLDWTDRNSRTTIEQNDKSARPQIGSPELSLDGYKTIFIGYPIWWGEEPRILDTFVEKYDFDGVTCIPFCTSGGSGVGRSDSALHQNVSADVKWAKGVQINRPDETEIRRWLEQAL
jgi:flavodoxin/predicted small lipoprotein YifL